MPTNSAKIDIRRFGVQAALLAAALLAVLLLSWRITAAMAVDFYAALEAGDAAAWAADGVGFALIFAMWAVMMAAMMLPGALPAIAIFFRISAASGGGAQAASSKRRFVAVLKKAARAPAVLAAVFGAAYLAVWFGFSLAAAGLQTMVALSESWAVNAPLAAALLAAAGLFQLTRAKAKCLALCGDPLAFFLLRRRRGLGGAAFSGLAYGIFCLGCCWALMLLLFAGGVMDLRLIAALAAFAALEKILPPSAARALTLAAAFVLLIVAAMVFARI